MKRLKMILALVALTAMLATLPIAASATNSANTVAAVKVGDKLKVFGHTRDSLGVHASNELLVQPYIEKMSLNIHLFDEDGERILFDEDFGRLSFANHDLRLAMRGHFPGEIATLEIDQRAIDRLNYFRFTELVVANYTWDVVAVYKVEDIQALRDALELEDDELLCLSGEDAPVSVVNAYGIRRWVD